MRKFAFAILTAGFAGLLSVPANAAPVSAADHAPAVTSSLVQLAQVSVRIGDGDRRRYNRRVRVVEPRRACRTVVVRERRGNTTIVKRMKRC